MGFRIDFVHRRERPEFSPKQIISPNWRTVIRKHLQQQAHLCIAIQETFSGVSSRCL